MAKTVKNERVGEIYKEFKAMRDVLNDSYGEFNYSESTERNRTLKEFLDDSQKRANGYVPSRSSQDKEPWQANVFTNFTRNKIKAHIASVAKEPPKIKIRAVNENNLLSIERGDIMKNLVRASEYEGDSNPESIIIDEAWNTAINGTIIKYIGYLKTKGIEQIITEYDISTGTVKYKDGEEKTIEDRIIEVEIPVKNLFVRDPYIANIQHQPSLAWVTYLAPDEFNAEFGKYKDANKVKESGYKFNEAEQDLFYGEQWEDRVEAGKIEVIRYYNKLKNKYVIVANGIMLLDTIMLWGKTKKKYPFAKTVYEKFASEFFWGNSLPNILMGDQDVTNAFINSMIDKTYRSLESPMLIGMVNKDALDLEDEYVTGDTKIYVPDINQVKPMPVAGVTQSEVQMLSLVRRGADESSTDSLQSGFGGGGSTAREVVLANEKAEELKGLFYSSLKDLYVQKYRLRVLNILSNYNSSDRVSTVLGKEGEDVFYKIYNLPKADLTTGESGLMQIAVTDQPTINRMTKTKGKTKDGNEFNEIDIMQEQARMKGQPIEILMINSDYLDDWEYEIEVETESFYQKSRALDKAMELEKVDFISKLFPSIFQANTEELFKGVLKIYNESPDKYLGNMQTQSPAMPGMPPGAPQEGGAAQNIMGQIASPTQSLNALMGT